MTTTNPAPAEAPTEHSSQAEVWFLKEISYEGNIKRIITQNFNGPCSFIAICNILILRDKIQILPEDRTNVSYEFLSHLVCDYLLHERADEDISAALAALPCTQTGMDLNPLFTGPTSFRPGGHGLELELFELVGIDLLHGWLADPQSPEYAVISKVEDYDTAAMLLAEVDHLTNGQLLTNGDAHPQGAAASSSSSSAGPGPSSSLPSDQQSQKVADAIVVRQFLDNTWTQLTYHGLFALSSIIKPGSLAALFRSSHLSVLYKRPEETNDHTIYSLVTDHSFLHEPAVVWERLDDVIYGDPSYVDSAFDKSNMLGGDFAGQGVDPALYAVVDPVDEALAIQLQQEEDQLASEELARRQQRRQQRHSTQPPLQQPPQQQQNGEQKSEKAKKGLKKKADCIVM